MESKKSFYANIFEVTKNSEGKEYGRMVWSHCYTSRSSAKRGLERRMKKMGIQGRRKFISSKPWARELSMENLSKAQYGN